MKKNWKNPIGKQRIAAIQEKMMLSIAHDLRSPLAVIKESAELLPGIEEKTKQDEYAENICHSSDYMLGLVNTLMEFYLLDTGQIKLYPTPFHCPLSLRRQQKTTLYCQKRDNSASLPVFRFECHCEGRPGTLTANYKQPALQCIKVY